MEESNIRVYLKIHGRVQGVGYRYFVQKHANDLGLTGWVQNKQDGTVDAEFQGPKENVEEMINFCSVGPGMAEVSHIDKEDQPLKDEIAFRVKQ